jgi:hypothetical protein
MEYTFSKVIVRVASGRTSWAGHGAADPSTAELKSWWRASRAFLFPAASWQSAGRRVAKVGFHAVELFPRIGFIVTNLKAASGAVVHLLGQTTTLQQCMKRRQAGGQDDAAFLPALRG